MKTRARAVRFGWIPAVYGVVVALYLLTWTVVAGAAEMLANRLELPLLRALPLYLGGILGLPLLVFAVLTLLRVRRLQHGTPGRLRLTLLGVSGVIEGLTVGGVLAFASFLLAHYEPSPFGGGIDPNELLLPLSEIAFAGLLVTAVVHVLGHTVLFFAALASWFLTPKKFRIVFWWVVDIPLTVGFLAVSALLPLNPLTDAPEDVLLPALRLGVSTGFVIRALARLLPPALDLVERAGFNPLVAARHLRAKKSGFLTVIGVLSISAVTVASAALTMTLSVMGGFRNDLKKKILGNNAHVVVDKEHDTFDHWVPTLRAVRETEGVRAAAPYVAGEVMVTSASNLAGAVLRGIDPESASEVIDLEANMVHGRLEYLVEPRQLLDLPPEETQGLHSFNVPTVVIDGDEDGEPPEDDDGASPVRDVDGMLGEAPSTEELDELERLIRDGPDPIASPREVLPGIIVGQELARSLRLYVGDEVNVVSPLGELGPAGPMPKSRPFRVAGIFYSGMYEYDMKYTYVMLETAQRFLNVGEEISGIEIKVDDVERAEETAERVEARVSRSELRVQDWKELNSTLFGALQLERLAMFVFLGIAILVAGFCVFATLTLMVQEKSSEMGILKAMGAGRGDVIRIFLVEGFLIGILGAGLGCGLGYVACFAAEHFGVRMNPEVYYIDKLPVHIDHAEFVAVGVAAVVVCVLATIFPAVLASRTRPVDALRYD
jgi:lipoprotein-releasing system permease protein